MSSVGALKAMFLVLLYSCIFTVADSVAAQIKEPIPTVFDTDFVMPPQDDGLALMLALQSPEIEILGIMTVLGNDSVERATSDVLRTHMPLVHEKVTLPCADMASGIQMNLPKCRPAVLQPSKSKMKPPSPLSSKRSCHDRRK